MGRRKWTPLLFAGGVLFGLCTGGVGGALLFAGGGLEAVRFANKKHTTEEAVIFIAETATLHGVGMVAFNSVSPIWKEVIKKK